MSTMDKSVYNMKAEKIQKQVKQGDYNTAAKICDTIDWTQVQSARMLSLVSSVYEHVGRYDTAIDILLMAYEGASAGRRFLYKLTELAIAAGNVKEAEEYYKNYLDEAGDDNSRYILRYKLAVMKNESIDKKITILEAYKRQELDEEWAYELACLYEQTGNIDRCVQICDEVIIWFGVGTFVEKAKALKEKYKGGDGSIEVAIAGRAESGQQVSALDMSVFRPEDGETIEDAEEEEDPSERIFANTRRVSEKKEFTKTRIFEKLPASESEMQLFKTIVNEEKEDEAEPEEAQAQPAEKQTASEPVQMELLFEEDEEKPETEEKKISHVLFVGADTPNIAMEQAVEAIKNAHEAEGSKMTQISRISAVKLNGKGMINSLEAIAEKDLIVLGASALKDDILFEIRKTAELYDEKKIIVLADSTGRIELVREKYGAASAKKQKPEYIPEPEQPEQASAIETAVMSELASVVDSIEEEDKALLEKNDFSSEIGESETTEPESEEPDTEDEEPAITEPEQPEEPEYEEYETEEAEPEEPEEPAHTASEPENLSGEPERLAAKKMNVSKGKKVMEPEQFLDYIKTYMRRIDCVFAEGTEQELLDYIRALKDDGEVLDSILAEEMVEEAANVAESHSFGNMFRTRYDESGNLILRAKHFV